jgi:hypothetical protein
MGDAFADKVLRAFEIIKGPVCPLNWSFEVENSTITTREE